MRGYFHCRDIGHRAKIDVEVAAVAVGWPAERNHAGFAWAQVLDDALDRAILAGAVATFEDDEGGPSRYWRNDPMRNPEPGSDQAQGSALFNKG